MGQLLSLVLVLLIIGGANALRWWLEKAAKEKERIEREQHEAAQSPQGARPGARPVFYGRSSEPTAKARPHMEPPAPQPVAPPVMRPQTIRPQPPKTRPARPPAAAQHPAARRPRRSAQAKPVAGEPGVKEAPAGVGSLEGRRLGSLGAPSVSALREQRLQSDILAEPSAQAEAILPRRGAGFLGDLLKGRNLAKAVVLSEVLGPPRAFRGL